MQREDERVSIGSNGMSDCFHDLDFAKEVLDSLLPEAFLLDHFDGDGLPGHVF